MSLIDDFKVECVMLDKVKTPDGAGGYFNEWKEGAVFYAAITSSNSTEMKIAEAQGLKRVYDVTTDVNVVLDYHDVFKRVSDGATFRVTSDGEDKKTPQRASFSFSQVTAERWELPK